MADLLKRVLGKEMGRRDFLKISAAGVAGLSLTGCGSELASTTEVAASAGGIDKKGKWVTAACWFDCGGKCKNVALVADGVVIRQKTDDTHPDSPDYPQQRGCLRGRSHRRQVFGADRIKYPMKRKHWEPLTGGDKSLRGRDEWERISWDEALDYVAAELKNAKEKHSNRSILAFDFFFQPLRLLNAFGGHASVSDTASIGTFAYVAPLIGLDFLGGANDRFDMRKSETIVMYGNNPAWSSLGSPSYNYYQAKKAGAKFICVGPNYNSSANMLDAKWIRVRPGTDTAFLLAVAYTMITEDDPKTNPIIDWDFLNKCTVGFDAKHMPKDAKLNENFKDYVLGKYDDTPKTPEWATEICGTPVEDIVWFARELRKDKKVSLLFGRAPSRCNNAESFPQIIMTIGAMGGHFGKPGHACGPGCSTSSGNCGPDMITLGDTSIPLDFSNAVEDSIIAPEVWDAVIKGKYNFAATYDRPGSVSKGMRDIDIRVIYNRLRNSLSTNQDVNKGIEAYRKVDFVVTHAFSLNASAQYSDIVLPITTQWERHSNYGFFTGNREAVVFPSKVIEPLYEAKSDQWIEEELAKRLGMDPKKVYPYSEEQTYFNMIAGAQVINKAGTGYEPLVTITEKDISEWSAKWGPVKGTPQQGKIGLMELMEQGVYQVERSEGDNYGNIAYKDFVNDPYAHPLQTKSGKFEIYCQTKADWISGMGRGKVKPYPEYMSVTNGYEQSFKDWKGKVKGDYPYQMYNPHYLRRSHTSFDNIPQLREALTNPVYISARDAADKGIKDGDTVLIYNSYGKILRQATISEQLVPGCIEVLHGAWPDIDEKTGIDRSGSDNVLSASVTSACGVSGYNTNLVNFEKYDGKPLEPDCLKPLKIVNIK